MDPANFTYIMLIVFSIFILQLFLSKSEFSRRRSIGIPLWRNWRSNGFQYPPELTQVSPTHSFSPPALLK